MISLTGDHGLVACYADADEKTIDRELKRLDPGLFLDRELDHARRVVHVVKHHVGSGQPPVPVLVWADPGGVPLPPSMGIVDRVRAQEKRNEADLIDARAMAENAVQTRRRGIREWRDDETTILKDHAPRTPKPRFRDAKGRRL